MQTRFAETLDKFQYVIYTYLGTCKSALPSLSGAIEKSNDDFKEEETDIVSAGRSHLITRDPIAKVLQPERCTGGRDEKSEPLPFRQ